MFKWISFSLAAVYLWLYPSILLVPAEYRQGFWSAEQNVIRRGVIVERHICETKSIFNDKIIYSVDLLTNGDREHFWVTSHDIFSKLKTGDLVSFETRGKVIVLAGAYSAHPVIVSLLNY